jgi:hypothetical protein
MPPPEKILIDKGCPSLCLIPAAVANPSHAAAVCSCISHSDLRPSASTSLAPRSSGSLRVPGMGEVVVRQTVVPLFSSESLLGLMSSYGEVEKISGCSSVGSINVLRAHSLSCGTCAGLNGFSLDSMPDCSNGVSAARNVPGLIILHGCARQSRHHSFAMHTRRPVAT